MGIRRWFRRLVREEVDTALVEMMEGEQSIAQFGGYDGATEVIDDDWADEGRIGFKVSRKVPRGT